MTKILIASVFQKNCSGYYMLRAFKKLGVEIETIDYRDYWRLTFFNRIINKVCAEQRYFNVRKLNDAVYDKVVVYRPDFVLFTKAILFYPETLKKITHYTKIFEWYPDYLFFRKTCSAYYNETIPLYDCYFSFNFANVEMATQLGAKKSLFLPCAADPDYHHPTHPIEDEQKKLGSDIVFIGTWANERRAYYLEKLCSEGYDIKIYGDQWKKHPQNSYLHKKQAIIPSSLLIGNNMSKILNSSKITLAFVRDHNQETLGCRSYEIPACGAFMLHQRTSKITEIFKEDEEVVLFSSYEEMKEKIDFYLKHDDLRKKIARKGYEKIMQGGNFFTDRVQVILDVFNKMNN